MNTEIQAYTDGSAVRPDKGATPGGFAYVLLSGDKRRERFGCASNATVNEMELAAIILALRAILPGNSVRVFSDSNYAIHCLNKWGKGWKRNGWITATGQPVKNRPLIEAGMREVERIEAAGGTVRFTHVRGHTGVTENERCDALASMARRHMVGNFKSPVELPGLDISTHNAQPRRRQKDGIKIKTR